MAKINNARLGETSLGVEDHGFFTFQVLINEGATCQSFGTFILGNPEKDEFSEYIGHWIHGICKAAGVDSWEKVANNYIRVIRDDCYDDYYIEGLGHIVEDYWIIRDKESGKPRVGTWDEVKDFVAK